MLIHLRRGLLSFRHGSAPRPGSEQLSSPLALLPAFHQTRSSNANDGRSVHNLVARYRNPDRPDFFVPSKDRGSRIREVASSKGFPTPKNNLEFINWSNQVSGEIGQEMNLMDRVYKGKSQLEVYGHLWREAWKLAADAYFQRGDQSGWTLMGAKGIGKSAALRNFTDIGNAVFPSVIPIYISFNKVGADDFCLRGKSICEAVFKQLEQNWTIVEPSPREYETKSSRLERTLLENGLHILLLVDDFDQLYRTNDPALHAYLFELIAFANNPLGRIGTTVCGSSAAMNDLVTCKRSSHIFEYFPNLRYAPKLDGTIFKAIHLSSNVPVSLDVLSEIANIPLTSENIGVLRLVLFATGASARQFGKQRDEIDSSPKMSLSSSNALSNQQAAMLWNQMCDKMIQKNCQIFDKIVVNNHLQYDSIMGYPWETEFKPLTYAEVEIIWSSMIASAHVPNKDELALNLRLFDLSDQAWIVLDGVKDGCPARMFPSCLWHLARRRLSDDHLPSVMQILNAKIQQCLKNPQ